MSATEVPLNGGGSADPRPATGAVPPQGTANTSAIHDPSTPHGQLGLAFKRAMVAVRRLRGRETHRPGQLSYAQFGLLFGLAGDCRRSARELADLADLTPATVTQMLESLESAGLITRTRSELDRRVVLSELTARGAEVISERRAQMDPRWRAALEGFDADELHTASRVLNRLADYFDEMLEAQAQD